MAEVVFLDISLETWASIAVAIGTLMLALFTVFLAYSTYRHMQSSDRQLELLKMSTERPMVLEFIRETLNPIYNDLTHENEIIKKKDILWLGENVTNNLDQVPLVFPISLSKDFYASILKMVSPSLITSNPDIEKQLDTICFHLEKRRQLYEEMTESISGIERIIEESDLNEIIGVLFSKDISIERKPQIGGESYELYLGENNSIGVITQKKLEEITISMLISSLFKPLKSDEFRIGSLGYSQLTLEFLPYMGEMLRRLPDPKIAPYVQRIDILLDILENTNSAILADTNTLRNILKDRYYLTESEITSHSCFAS